jgi:hypothetical protein
MAYCLHWALNSMPRRRTVICASKLPHTCWPAINAIAVHCTGIHLHIPAPMPSHCLPCRVPTQYDTDSGVLTISHTPECDAVQYAYFAPYTYNRHRQLIARTQVWLGHHLQLTETQCSAIGMSQLHSMPVLHTWRRDRLYCSLTVTSSPLLPALSCSA